MNQLLDAFWRAAAYCLHPRVIALSLAPLLLAGGLTLALGWFFWEPAVDGVRATLQSWALIDALLKWLEALGGTGLRAMIAPLVIVALGLPVIVVLSLLMVALLMAPALVSLGFEPMRFQQVMKGMDILALVQADIKEASGLGIRSTPSSPLPAVMSGRSGDTATSPALK